MRKFKLNICYDGTNYCGWQVQPNGITVQQKLCEALQTLTGAKTDVTGCSRTDSGVHANDFCCHFETENESIDSDGFVGALNYLLPKDIAVRSCAKVPGSFHARYDCKGKQYVYKMYLSATRDPFLDGYALRVPKELNVDRINEFCRAVTGTHDFRGFSSSGRTVSETVRTIKQCEIEFCDGIYLFSVTGDGFLYNMVRILVGTALDVSAGKLETEKIIKIFETGDRSEAGATAPPHGLYLNKVFY